MPRIERGGVAAKRAVFGGVRGKSKLGVIHIATCYIYFMAHS